MAIRVGHQLVGLLARRVEAHRVIHTLVLGKRQLSVTAIHRAATGVEKVLHTVMTAPFQNVSETN